MLISIQEKVAFTYMSLEFRRQVRAEGIRLGVQLVDGFEFMEFNEVPKGESVVGQEKMPED